MSLKLFLGSFLQLSSFQHPPTSKFVWNKNSVYIGNKMVNSLTSHKSAHYFFREKTGSRKSGKNPDIKFREFLDRYCYLTIPNGWYMNKNKNIL